MATLLKKECYVCNHKGRWGKVRSLVSHSKWVCKRIHVNPVKGFGGYNPARNL